MVQKRGVNNLIMNKTLDTTLLDRVIIFAVRAHAGTERRGKGLPYIVHPMEAVEIVATITPDQEMLAAAALHDTVEDTAIDRLAYASRDAKIVALGDKLSNMRAIGRDYAQQGDVLWNLFHAKDPKDHEWHYRGLADALSDLSDTFAYREFENLINQVFGE